MFHSSLEERLHLYYSSHEERLHLFYSSLEERLHQAICHINRMNCFFTSVKIDCHVRCIPLLFVLLEKFDVGMCKEYDCIDTACIHISVFSNAISLCIERILVALSQKI